jgi:ankyrin
VRKQRDLAFYRLRAKELLKLAHAGDKEAKARFKRHHPNFKRASAAVDSATFGDAQLVIARENGFASWTRFKSYVATLDRARQESSPERLQSILRARDLEAMHEFIERVPKAVSLRIEPIGTTALHEAASGNWQDGVELLLEAGADINAVAARSAVTPLQTAIGFRNAALALWLLEHGADPTIEATPDQSTMKIAAAANDHAMIRALMDRGMEADIFAAITLQDEMLIRRLVIVDDSVLRQRLRLHEAITLSPLQLAAIHNLPRIVDLLIYLGADVNDVDEQNRTAVDLTLHTGKRESFERLYSHGCRPNPELLTLVLTPERSERIASLHAALVEGNKADVMTELDADPTLINQRLPDVWGSGGTFGATPLHWAAMFGHIEIAALLLERGADLNVKDLTRHGTPIDWAREYHRSEMVAFLEAHGGKTARD